jgi:hypothetical protein
MRCRNQSYFHLFGNRFHERFPSFPVKDFIDASTFDRPYQTAIAEKLGYTKGGVSKALKRMNLSVTSSAIIEAPKYEAAQDQA